jgi:hypothetical protein
MDWKDIKEKFGEVILSGLVSLALISLVFALKCSSVSEDDYKKTLQIKRKKWKLFLLKK